MKILPLVYWAVGPVYHRLGGDLWPGVDLDITLAIKDCAGDERFGLVELAYRLAAWRLAVAHARAARCAWAADARGSPVALIGRFGCRVLASRIIGDMQ